MIGNCRIGIGGLLILAATCAAQAAGEGPGGYRQDYDFPGQGDDWYGGMRLPQQRRDFPPPFLDQVLSGEDFCVGYERFVDLIELGPPLYRTNERNSAYAFRFDPAGEAWTCLEGGIVEGPPPPPDCNDGNRCTRDWHDGSRCRHTALADGTSCSNNVYCDGAETCLGGTCVSGTPPDCTDEDECTEDWCDEAGDTCRNEAPPIPDAVRGLMVDPSGPGEPTVVLHWDDQAWAEFYNVYRSVLDNPGDLVCLAPGILGTSVTDDGTLPPGGQAFYFLPTAANCAGESSLGEGQSGERPNPSPCD
jgi:hypothetical protein